LSNNLKGDLEMTRKMLVVALALTASMLVATNVFAAPCDGGAQFAFNGVGSSAQTNSLAYAAKTLTNDTTQSPTYNLISFKSWPITDKGPSTPVSDNANPWIVWDFNNVCNVYMYWQTDSGIGVKDFFRYEKYLSSNGKTYTSVAAASGAAGSLTHTSNIPGLPDSQTTLPSAILTLVNGNPEALADANVNYKTSGGNYCGNVSSVTTAQFRCYFNVAGTDIRPEDALFAFTRALTTYNGLDYSTAGGTKVGTGQLTGMGYNNTACGGDGVNPTGKVGCPLKDAFGQNDNFNVVTFKLSGTDPLKSGTLPGYTTLSAGASPLIPFVRNGTVFGNKTAGVYDYHDINRRTLAQVFSGYTHCTGDLLTNGAGGPGSPIQVVQREVPSGTYNAWEFTAVRTVGGGGNPAADPGPPISAEYNGQEQFNDPGVSPSLSGCSYDVSNKYPQANCFDPFFWTPTTSRCSGSTGNIPVRLRAVGTGHLVSATLGKFNTGNSGNTTVDNSIGYAFWSYGNFDPLCSGIASGGTTCTGSFIGHYLTVDSIDPLFSTSGDNPNPTANDPPVCDITGSTPTCFLLPFTHIKDGSYPLWSLLRLVTFAPVSGKTITPPTVIDLLASQEQTVVSLGLSDYVPFLTNLSTTGSGLWKGDLNLFVFRSHYAQSGVQPANGHKGCTAAPPNQFKGVNIQGGKAGAATCLVDFGGDEGGSVLTVQSDADFVLDWSKEEYNLRQ
jgi:hypothetical protein